MKGFKQRLLPLLLLCLAGVVGWAGNPAPAVVPAVRQWTGGKGVWKFSGAQVAVPAAEWPVLEPVAKRFAADLTLMGMTSVAVPVTGDLSTRDLVLTTNTGNFRLRNDEGYAVEITDRVVIRGQTATAVLWGTRTLLQMLHQDRQLPRGTVADWPQYPHRILQLNVGNHYLPLTMLKDYVACMSWFKLNELQLCLDGAETGERPQGFFRVECDTIPGLTSREHYTRQQLRELQDWAALHGVVVIPEIRFPGAALAFTRIAPDLRASGLDAAQIDVRNPAACLFLQRLFDEIIPLFDARLVHLGSPDYSLEQVAAGQLPEWTEACRKHLDRLSTYAQSRFNKSIRIWETSQRLPEMNVPMRTTTIDVWQKSEIAGVRLAAGRKIINSSIALPSITPESPDLQLASRSLYETWTPDRFGDYCLPPPDPLDEAPGLIGASLRLWEDTLPGCLTMIESSQANLEAVVAFAEKTWNGGGLVNYADFRQRTAAVGFAPGIRLFERLPATADGLVVSRPGPCALKVPADHVDILEPGHEQLLEWPWTLALEIRCDKPGDGILLSAPAAEIYGGLAWTVSQEGRRRLQHGLGLVRSSGTASPLQSQSPVVAVIEAALPRNQWSRLVLTGEQGRTSIYLDGVRIGTVNIQMVCPIGTIGGHHNDSFVCGIRNLEIWKRAWSAGEVEHWTPKARNWWQSGKNITLGKP